MRIIIRVLFVWCALFLSSSFCEDVEYGSSHKSGKIIDGFENIKWNDPIEKLGNYTIITKALNSVSVDKEQKIYNQILDVGYSFYNGKLYSIVILFTKKDVDAYPIIRDALVKKYLKMKHPNFKTNDRGDEKFSITDEQGNDIVFLNADFSGEKVSFISITNTDLERHKTKVEEFSCKTMLEFRGYTVIPPAEDVDKK